MSEGTNARLDLLNNTVEKLILAVDTSRHRQEETNIILRGIADMLVLLGGKQAEQLQKQERR